MIGVNRKVMKTVAGISAALGVVGLGTAAAVAPASAATGAGASAAAASAAASRPTWHTVGGPFLTRGSEIDAVVATGKTSGWAFSQAGAAAPASSASSVWAFADLAGATGSQVVSWNGTRWSVIKTFRATDIGGGTVLSKNDAWVFTANGVYHYAGGKWTTVSGTLEGGAALSDKDVWAFSGTTVANYNGSKWSTANLASLLPRKMVLNGPAIESVVPVAADNVYVVGSGRAQDEGGPIVVLHYNGRGWSKVGEVSDSVNPEWDVVSYDGNGGLWIPAGEQGRSALLHYSDGKFTKAALPGNGQPARAVSVSRIPGTADQLAGGFLPAADGSTYYALIMQYS
jgi:hypothetical protein